MTYKFATWYAAERCTGGAGDGARALMRYLLDEFDDAKNWGIYNCRDVAGTSTTSAHGEGRALDIGMPIDGDGTGSKAGHQLVDALGTAGRDLGVMCIIYDRMIWSKRSPDGRKYTGV